LHWRRSSSVQVKPVIIEITAREDSNAGVLLNLIVDTLKQLERLEERSSS